MAILPFSTMFSTTLKRIIYTITMYFYSFRLAFSSILHCIQHQNTLHLAPKHTAFSTKTHCVQHQNALRLAAYCTPFSTKLQYIQQQIAQKLAQMAVILNKNSFCCIHKLTPFCIKTNLRENRFFAAQVNNRWTKRALRMLNFLLKTRHKKNNYAMLARMGNSTESTYTYYHQCGQLQGIH